MASVVTPAMSSFGSHGRFLEPCDLAITRDRQANDHSSRPSHGFFTRWIRAVDGLPGCRRDRQTELYASPYSGSARERDGPGMQLDDGVDPVRPRRPGRRGDPDGESEGEEEGGR